MAKKQYDNDFPSVTQLIGQLRSPGLEMWFKLHTISEINEISNRGKKIGTEIHNVIQTYIETGKAKIETEYPVEVTNALKSFMLFRKEMPEIILKRAELALTHPILKYNGTIDCLGEKEKTVWLVDWKTSEAKEKNNPVIYDEAKIQVSAYCNLINEAEERTRGKNDPFENAIIVGIAKDKIAYNTYFLNKEEIDGWFNEVFIPLKKIWDYRKKNRTEVTNGKTV